MSFRHERYIGLQIFYQKIEKYVVVMNITLGFYGNYTLAKFDETICFIKFVVRLFSIL